ncbi:MAG: beta-propeller domain-containing protein [bacterium]
MINFVNKEVNKTVGFLIIALIASMAVAGIALEDEGVFTIPSFSIKWPVINLPHISLFPVNEPKIKELEKFSSLAEFKEYLLKSQGYESYYGLGTDDRNFSEASTPQPNMIIDKELSVTGSQSTPDRVSGTNVQVIGIDEPDIVKTDGKNIYFAPQNIYGGWIEEPVGIQGKMIMPPYPYESPKTKIINAFPPAAIKKIAEISKTGNLLLVKNILIVFSSNNQITGYDVSDPLNPKEKWTLKLENSTQLTGVRLYGEKIYLVTATTVNIDYPCPIRIMALNGSTTEIKCTDIYHPVSQIPVDSTYTVMQVNPLDGSTEKKVSFVGSSGMSTVYMSENAIYATYPYYESIITFMARFIGEKATDLMPKEIVTRLKKLDGYDISQQSKMTEFQQVWDRYMNGLSGDEKLRIENELTNRMNDYYKDHQRDLEKTGIVKIGISDLLVKASGSVPGHLLNQFSMDEYNSNLRVAVTIGQRWGVFNGLGSGETANDVYVMDQNLNIAGKVINLGLTEKIYSVRFIEDKGYLVTFRETDPFYVLDLSNPRNPQLKGELKIPGYSGYLHPLKSGLILGIGKENWQVKISLFDVSSDKDPREVAKYILKDSWSDVLNNHHAFLNDPKHEIFFMPGSNGGYVFSYKLRPVLAVKYQDDRDNRLEMVKAISDISARRAVYINDYLYVIGDDKIRIFNENDWQEVNSLILN